MRVLAVWSPIWISGGAEKFAIKLFPEIAKKFNVDITMIALSLKDNRLHVYSMDSVVYLELTYKALLNHILKSNYDVIVYHDAIVFSLRRPLILISKAPILIDLHCPDHFRFYRHLAYGERIRFEKISYLKLIGKFKTLFVRTLNHLDYYILGKVLDFDKIFLIPNFVDTNFYRPVNDFNEKLEKFRILIHVSLHPQKGLDLFLQALYIMWRRLRHLRDIEVIGFGGDRLGAKALKYVCERVGVKCHTYGWVDERLLPELFSKATLGVVPSRYEGFPLLALEILACGTPIVTSSIPATKWYLIPYSQDVDKANGEIFKAEDVFSLATTIIKMYKLWKEDYDTFKRLCRNARRIALRYDIKVIAKLYYKMLGKVADHAVKS